VAKFQRKYYLYVEDIYGGTVEISLPISIEFDVTRNPLSSICTANIRVFNLKESTRNRIYKDQYNTNIYRSCELRAGYGTDLPTIFKGNVTRCYSQRVGTNYITNIEIYDGQYAIMNGWTSKTIDKGMTKQTLIDSLMSDLPKINSKVIGKYEGTIPRANAISGNTADLLKELTSGGFFIDSETAYALKDGECVQGVVNLINSDAGLLGSPQREETMFTFDMIFEPRIKMCQYLELESSTEKLFNGQYKVISIQHKGMISDAVCGQVIMNKIPSNPSLQIVLELLKKDIFSSLHCHAIGKIESFDATNQTAKISIDYSRLSVNDENMTSNKKEYPVLAECPVIVLGGGKGSLRFPIKTGDSCLVLFNDRDIDNWFTGGSKSVLNSDRMHSFSDAIAIVGVRSLANSLKEYSTEKVELVNDKTKISLGEKVKIVNQTQNLFTILDGVLGILAAFTSTNAVPGSPVALSPAQVAQVNAFKTQLGQLME